jgi:hypothetical protein
MFPCQDKRQKIVNEERLLEKTKAIKEWYFARFCPTRKLQFKEKVNIFVKLNFTKLINIEEHFEIMQKLLDKVGYCEYCEDYIGLSPVHRRSKNIGVLYGCCKELGYQAVKYNGVCSEWFPKKFWRQLIYYTIRKYYGPFPYNCDYCVDYEKEDIKNYKAEKWIMLHKDPRWIEDGY